MVPSKEVDGQEALLPNVMCGSEVGKHHCTEASGRCVYIQDGYYYVNTVLVILGVVLFLGYIWPSVNQIQSKIVRGCFSFILCCRNTTFTMAINRNRG